MAGKPEGRSGTSAYRRILLKISGEALMGDDACGINRQVMARMVCSAPASSWRWLSVAEISSVELHRRRRA